MAVKNPVDLLLEILPPIQKRNWKKEKDSLAPSPINFKTEKVYFHGHTYITTWNGHSLKLMDGEDGGNGYRGNGNGYHQPDPNPYSKLPLLFLLLFVGLYVWYKIIRMIFF